MARSAIQFQKDLSLTEFQRLYGIEEKCEAALEQTSEAAQAERERLQELWSGLRVGDGVKLSRNVSREILVVPDDEGCQIELDGVTRAIEGEQGRVEVFLVSKKFGQSYESVSLNLRRSDLERTEGIRVWSKKDARAIKRRHDGVEMREPYWVEIC